jgi:DNA-binding SARP family transcriptional activator/Tfp pilus assembly protein PilF
LENLESFGSIWEAAAVAAQFRLLGNIEVRIGDRPVDVGHARQRTVLVTLLVDANRFVSLDQLVDRVWAGHRLPIDPVNALRTYVSLLRRALGSSTDVAITRRSGGYQLTVDPAAVDLHLFHGLLSQARQGTDDHGSVTLLEQALQLWRGEPLAGLGTLWAGTIRAGLVEARRTAELDLVDAQLRLGQHDAVLARLSRRAAADPLDERVAGQLMLALAGSGRRADALGQYQRIRRELAEELGTDPGATLQQLHRAILAGDHGSPAPAIGDTNTAKVAPAQLPADVSAFTGRTREVAALDDLLLAERPDGARAMPISVLSGTAGVGKTTLAVHWTHRVVDRFPDGQLYVDLRGYDQPMSAMDALAGFLTALGVPEQDIPLEPDKRAARYRTEVSGRRMLIVLDNASSAEHVRPLLPGTPSCAVVVTSRDSLAGLVVLHGAHRLDLDLLQPANAQALVRRLVGARAEAEPAAVAVLADRCARLPLALRLAAELVISRPASAIRDLADELADEQRRLDLLDAGGDPRAAVAAVFSWSMRHLPPEAAATFRRLGLHPGPDLDAYATAALTGSDVASAARMLDRLTRAHLVHPTTAGRYGMHDLLRAYATALTTEEEPESVRAAALCRLCDYYLAAAAAAVDGLYPADVSREHHPPPPAMPIPDLNDLDAARTWLDTERPTLIRVAAHADAHGWPTYTIRLSIVLRRYLDSGHHIDALTLHGYAHRATLRTGDVAAQARVLQDIGTAHLRLARYVIAAEHLRQSLALSQQADDHTCQARALGALGIVNAQLGQREAAIEHFELALALFRQTGDQTGEANALNNLGIVAGQIGRHESAIAHFELALILFRQTGDQIAEANTLNNLGLLDQRMGHYASAVARHEQALDLFRRLGARSNEAKALDHLGIAHLRIGQPDQGIAYLNEALTISRAIGDRVGEAWVLNGLGEADQANDRPTEAIAQHSAALRIAIDIKDPDQRARAHAGLGQAHRTLADHAEALRHYETALNIYTELNSPEADAVQVALASIADRRS